jgi:uncharacterized GH25 family protein
MTTKIHPQGLDTDSPFAARGLQRLLLFAALATTAAAHDFWLEPATLRPVVGQRVEVQLVVGEHFAGDPVARQEQRIVRFVASDPRGHTQTIAGRDGRAPAGIWRASTPGLHVLGYQSHATSIELEAEKFERSLASEGLEFVVEERNARGESARPGREKYARCAKSLVVARGDAELEPAQWAGWDRALDLPLEIVPEVDPSRLAPGAKLVVRVLFQGAPLANGLVGCMPQLDPTREVRLRTDAEGRVAFEPELGGLHMLRVVHMTRAARGAAHDWESQWASLTFEMPKR